MKRHAYAAFLAGALALSLAACGGSCIHLCGGICFRQCIRELLPPQRASDLDYIKGKGKMVIGYTVYEPMNYTDADGNFTGFDTELATARVRKAGSRAGVGRSTGTPRRPSWPPRASTASGTA